MPDRFTEKLISNLRYRLTWVTVVEHYLMLRPKPDIETFLQNMLEVDQLAVDLLARSLRKADIAPSRIDIDELLARQGKMRRTFGTRLRFIDAGLRNSLDWYLARLDEPEDPYHDVWQELYDRQSELVIRLAVILDKEEDSQNELS